MENSVSGGIVKQFQEDGAVLLKNAFSRDWVDKLKSGIEKNLKSPSEYSERLQAPGGPGYYFNDYCNWQRIDEFKDFVWNSPAAEIAGQLMQSKYSVFYHEHVLTKDPGTYKVTPWHHDQAYYPIDGDKNCSLWIPVDNVPVESAIEFIQGSHRWGKWFYPRKFETSKNYNIENEDFGGKKFYDVPDIENHREDYHFLKWECQVGDCIAFHMKTLHGAPVNSQDKPRRVISTRWLGEDCVLAERAWAVSPPIKGDMNIGGKFICDKFPVIWKRK